MNPGTGDLNYNYLIEVEAGGEMKSTHGHAVGSDKKAVGTKKENDGEGEDAGQASQFRF